MMNPRFSLLAEIFAVYFCHQNTRAQAFSHKHSAVSVQRACVRVCVVFGLE